MGTWQPCSWICRSASAAEHPAIGKMNQHRVNGVRLEQIKSVREAGGKQNLKFLGVVVDENVLGAGRAFVNPQYSVHTKRSAPSKVIHLT